jgi:hypothetical protein
MPTTPKESKRLLELLISKRNLPFDEVLQIFTDSKGKLNRMSVTTVLNGLWVGDTFRLFDQSGSERSWRDDAVFDSPAEFTLRFNAIEGMENSIAKNVCDVIDDTNINEIAPKYRWAGLKRQEQLRIVGDREDAELLAERIRAFTHQFAFHLVSGRHAELAGLFSDRAAQGQALEALLKRMKNLEKEFGPFDYFDGVKVISVFNGDCADVTASAHMKLPKGVDRNEQRGWSQFQIISVRTPNGLYVHEYSVALSIIDRDRPRIPLLGEGN